jgi:hypothetical protein
MIEAYPLCWPLSYSRTISRKKSRFKITLGQARDFVKDEVRRLGGTDLVISTNIPIKDNGDLRADWSRYRIDDPGVAVYFSRKNPNGKGQICLCCDTYEWVWENLYAIGRTIEALRQIDRDGVSDFLDRAFTGFKALPEQVESTADIWAALGLQRKPESLAEVKEAYRNRLQVVHPDKPTGSTELFHQLQRAYSAAQNFF